MSEREITIKKGLCGKGTTYYWLYHVLLDGSTKRTFVTSEEAEVYAKELRKKYPTKRHHGTS